MEEISAPKAAELLRDQPEQTILLDVREAAELEVAAVPGAVHIPMGVIPARLAEIDTTKSIIDLGYLSIKSVISFIRI